MKLIYKEIILGTICNISREGYWNYGLFEKNCNYDSFECFFADLVCEEGFDDNKYEKDFCDNQNWYVLKSDEKIGISLPAIYDDGEISFRYR